jgi:tetratricopeptide (TPR) repeat protein
VYPNAFVSPNESAAPYHRRLPYTPRIRIAERLACLAAIPALGCGIYYSARVAVADGFYRLDTPQSLAQAVRADPTNASYHQLYAEHLESAGMDPAREREAAALLSPLDSQYWIDLGTLAEVRGDNSSAERYYLKAASVDRKFAPRQALMNFYLRRHDEKSFWEWTQKAMEMAHDDSSQLFRLCWLMSGDAESIRRRIPRQNDYLQLEYLRFLMEEGHLDVAESQARDRAERGPAAEVSRLLQYCDLVRNSNTAGALAVWNTLVRRKLEPYRELDPRAGAIVTNGDFRAQPIERGFDWYLPEAGGVSVTLGASSGLTVELTGDQAEAATVLREWVPVSRGSAYSIQYKYSSEDEGLQESRQPSGLAWEIENAATGARLLRGADLKTGSSGDSGSVEFSTDSPGIARDAASTVTVTLALRYQRTPGTVRRHEKFTIESVSSGLATGSKR